MTTYRLIGPREFAAFSDALVRHGWQPTDFELQEDVFDPATAEVEAALGEVGVKCLKTDAVTGLSGRARGWTGSPSSRTTCRRGECVVRMRPS
jgi:hypothetical protein